MNKIRVWMTNMQRASNLEIAQEIVIFMMMVLSSVRPRKGPTQHRGRAASELLATVPDYLCSGEGLPSRALRYRAV